MSVIVDSALLLDDLYDTVDDARAAARTFLIAAGRDPWTVDTALAGAYFDRGWWSDQYNGFTHDCAQHLPEEANYIDDDVPGDPTCWRDAREVTVVGSLPPSVTGNGGG